MKLLIFDTESTARNGQICQLAYLVIDGDCIRGRNLYFAVDSVSADTQAIHGLSTEMLLRLSGGVRFAGHANDILEDFAAADLWIGHNVAADEHMLRLEMQRLGLTLPQKDTLCTMNRFTPVLKLKRLRGPGSPKPPKLRELCDHYGVSDDAIAARCAEWFLGGGAAHDAHFDVAATYLCLCEAVRKGDIPPIA